MKASSGHFVFKDRTEYRDMAEVFPDVLKLFLEETDQLPEDAEIMQMFIHLNLVELENNRKPEGYNRKGRMRLIFPTNRMGFYIKGSSKSGEVVRVTEKISKLLTKNGVDHELEWNALSCSEALS
jgi:CTP-dependent riboflavin kinase